MRARVVKVGGRVVGDDAWLSRFAELVARAGDGLVVVHGGGLDVDELCGRLGVPVVRQNGLRVTTPEALDVATLVLSGRLNKRLVRALVSAGVDAIGISGEDGGLLVAGSRPEARSAGSIAWKSDRVAAVLLGLGLVPVVRRSPRGDGGALNVNATRGDGDRGRAGCRAALRHGRSGARRVTTRRADAAEAETLLDGIARDGMAVKVRPLSGLRAGCLRRGSAPWNRWTGAGTWLWRTGPAPRGGGGGGVSTAPGVYRPVGPPSSGREAGCRG